MMGGLPCATQQNTMMTLSGSVHSSRLAVASTRRTVLFICCLVLPSWSFPSVGGLGGRCYIARRRSHRHDGAAPIPVPSTGFPLARNDDNTEVPLPDGALVEETFHELYDRHLPAWLLARCAACGWRRPSRAQRAALDAVLVDGRDAVVQAETGSGKTLAYLLPCLAAVNPDRAAVQALVVVPTRELGLQVARVARRLAAGYGTASGHEDDASDTGSSSRITVMNVLQGSKNRRQRAWAWAEPPHIVVGTPRELADMVRLAGFKRYNSLRLVVVDEVDACLLNNAGSLTTNLRSSELHELLAQHLSPTYDDGAGADAAMDSRLQQVQKAIADNARSQQRPLSRTRQTIFCSATIPQPRHFLRQCVQNQWMLREPVHVCLRSGEQLLPETLEHGYSVCRSSSTKLAGLRRMLLKIYRTSSAEAPRKVLVFCEPQRPMLDMAAAIAGDLPEGRAMVAVLQYDDNLSDRAAAMESFRGEAGSDDSKASEPDAPVLRVLLSTDLAARGLDIVDITHIINFDLPPDADTFTHRAGRAGRFGRKGQVVSLVPPEQEFVLERLANKMNIDLKCIGRQKAASGN